MNLITLLQKQERTRKDLQQLIEYLSQIQVLKQLKKGEKLYQAMLRGFAEKARLIRFDRGHVIWREGVKQDKLFIILNGSVQEYVGLEENEIFTKRNNLISLYPECENILTNKPGRRIVYEYEEESDQIKASINDNMRRRRSLVYDIPCLIDIPLLRSSSVVTKQVKPFQTIHTNEAPLSYMIKLSKEVRECLRGTRLVNDYQLQYFIQDFVLVVQPGRLFQNGDLLNTNLGRKKFENTLVCLQDTILMTISLEDFQNIEIHENQRKHYKIYSIINTGLFGHQKTVQEDLNQIMKVLVEKYSTQKYTQNNIVYNQGDIQKLIYIVKEGEFQIQFESIDNKQPFVINIAIISTGCLLGDESYSSGRYMYKCTSISPKCKLIGLSIDDLEVLGHKFVWFRDMLKSKEKIKQNWLKTRTQENMHLKKQLSERQYNNEEEKRILCEFILPKESTTIQQFQRLKPSQPRQINVSPQKKPILVKGISARNVNTSRTKADNLNIFGNEILCELGIGKISQQNTKMTNNLETTDHSLTNRETSRLQLLKRIQRTQYTTSQPAIQRDNSTITLDVVPLMMNMNKNQMQFLKTVVGKLNRKPSQDTYTNCSHQQSSPVLIQTIYPQKIVRRTWQGYD